MAYFESMRRCFNATFIGWEHPEKRKECYQLLLNEYEAVGGKCVSHFIYTMEIAIPGQKNPPSPKAYLKEIFGLLKESDALSKRTDVSKEEFAEWYRKGTALCLKEHDTYLNITGCLVLDILQHYGMTYAMFCKNCEQNAA